MDYNFKVKVKADLIIELFDLRAKYLLVEFDANNSKLDLEKFKELNIRFEKLTSQIMEGINEPNS